MADLLTLSAVKKVEKNINNLTVGTKFNRPLHHTNKMCITGGNSCCVLVPATSNYMTIEMWGQGGGGGGAWCCRNGIFGGQGGSYGVKEVDLTGLPAQSLCGCACQCTCAFNCCCGHPGQCSRLTDCTNGITYIVTGGHGGCTCCFWQAGSYCGECNTQYNTAEASSINAGVVGMNKTQNASVTNLDSASSSSATENSGLDNIFQPVACANFDEYRMGACGWSGLANNGIPPNSCYGVVGGVGGASYAGGDQQWCNSSPTSYNGQGYCGNFPGGGGSSGASAGGTICCGGYGGFGLILVSWD